MAVNISTDTNTVKVTSTSTNNVKIVDNGNNTSVTVSQPTTRVIKVATVGPQGPAGPSVDTGSFATTGSNSFIGNQVITGSLIVSGSSAFTNIGPTILSGSVVSTQGFTGSFIGDGSGLYDIPASGIVGLNLSQISSGSVSASISPDSGLQVNTNVTATSFTGSLQGIASTASFAPNYTLTSSYNQFTQSYYQDSSSFDSRINNLPISQLVREEFTWISGSSQTFQLLSTASQVYSVEVQGQGALSISQYNVLSSSVQILDQLQNNDYITVLYTNATTGFQPYYSQAQVDGLVNNKELLSNKSTDINLGTSDTLYPTQNAVKTYVDGKKQKIIFYNRSQWTFPNVAAAPFPLISSTNFELATANLNSTTDNALTALNNTSVIFMPIGIAPANMKLKRVILEGRQGFGSWQGFNLRCVVGSNRTIQTIAISYSHLDSQVVEDFTHSMAVPTGASNLFVNKEVTSSVVVPQNHGVIVMLSYSRTGIAISPVISTYLEFEIE